MLSFTKENFYRISFEILDPSQPKKNYYYIGTILCKKGVTL